MWDTETAECVKELEVAIGSDVLAATFEHCLYKMRLLDALSMFRTYQTSSVYLKVKFKLSTENVYGKVWFSLSSMYTTN